MGGEQVGHDIVTGPLVGADGGQAARIKVSITLFLTTRYLITPETIIVIRQRFYDNTCREANRSLLPNTSSMVFMIIYPSVE